MYLSGEQDDLVCSLSTYCLWKMGSISSFSSLVTMFLVNISILGIKQQMGIKIVGARMCGRGKDC